MTREEEKKKIRERKVEERKRCVNMGVKLLSEKYQYILSISSAIDLLADIS